jgi:hypothetical protein
MMRAVTLIYSYGLKLLFHHCNVELRVVVYIIIVYWWVEHIRLNCLIYPFKVQWYEYDRMSILEEKWTRKIYWWHNPETTYLVWSCRENGPNATIKNYDSMETWRKEKTRLSPENLETWNIYSHEWKRSTNGRMEQSKAMEYESRKASSDALKPRNIYRFSGNFMYHHV